MKKLLFVLALTFIGQQAFSQIYIATLSGQPNPATDFIEISIDYNLKGESQVVFISEAGYVYHKESIGSISKNERHHIDISKIPAGKYLVTIVNGKTYTTPQKLIVF